MQTDKPAVDYNRDVKPILAANCYRCHGPDQQESGLRLDSGATALEGGNAGPALVRGKSAESLLIQAVTAASDEVSRMPPDDEADALSEQQIDILRRWIDAGRLSGGDATLRQRNSAECARRADGRLATFTPSAPEH